VPDPNRALFESVVRLLGPVLDDLVFVGGCTTGLFLTDSVASGIRPTTDVDAIVDVTSYAEYTSLAERLRALGLAEDTTSESSRRRCSSPRSWKPSAGAVISSRVTTSRTLSPSWMAARRSSPRLVARTQRFVPTLPRTSVRFSITPRDARPPIVTR
jgi:hypothetical protein